MTINELPEKLKGKEISEDQYFLHGLFVSKDDNDKIALTIKKGQCGIVYETYYRESGEKLSARIFTTEKEAYGHLYKKIIDERTIYRIQKMV